MTDLKDFVPLKMSMLRNNNLSVFVKMSQNMIRLDELNSDRSFLEQFSQTNKTSEQLFYVKRDELEDFIRSSNQKIKKSKDLNECVDILSSVGMLMFENFKINNLSEASLKDGFDLVQQTVTGDSKALVSDIIKSLSSNKDIGTQSLVRSMICYLTAQSLGWQREKNYQNLIVSSLLADIGNVLAPDESHPKNSLAFLGPYSDHSDIPSIVAHHHENFDGSGPIGLTRHKIHPLAKLLRLSDNIAENSLSSLSEGISVSLAEQRNLFEREPIFKLQEYLKSKKLIKI